MKIKFCKINKTNFGNNTSRYVAEYVNDFIMR